MTPETIGDKHILGTKWLPHHAHGNSSSETHLSYLTTQQKKYMSMVTFVHFITWKSHWRSKMDSWLGQEQRFLSANSIQVLYQAFITSNILWNPCEDWLLPWQQGGALGSVGKRANSPTFNPPTLCPPLHYTWCSNISLLVFQLLHSPTHLPLW